MFDLKYRIIMDYNELKGMQPGEFDDAPIIEGFFSLDFDGNIEGYYHNNKLKPGEEGFDNITTWIDYLLDVCQKLRNNYCTGKLYILKDKIFKFE